MITVYTSSSEGFNSPSWTNEGNTLFLVEGTTLHMTNPSGIGSMINITQTGTYKIYDSSSGAFVQIYEPPQAYSGGYYYGSGTEQSARAMYNPINGVGYTYDTSISPSIQIDPGPDYQAMYLELKSEIEYLKEVLQDAGMIGNVK